MHKKAPALEGRGASGRGNAKGRVRWAPPAPEVMLVEAGGLGQLGPIPADFSRGKAGATPVLEPGRPARVVVMDHITLLVGVVEQALSS